MPIGKLIIDEDRNCIVLLAQLLAHGASLRLGHLKARPAVPLEARSLGETAQASNETARRHGEGVLAIIAALDSDRQAVRDQKQPAGRSALVFDKARHGDSGARVLGSKVESVTRGRIGAPRLELARRRVAC